MSELPICPVCERVASIDDPRCTCGYDFTSSTATVAIDRLRLQRAVLRRRRVLAWVMFIPVLTSVPIILGGTVGIAVGMAASAGFFAAVGVVRARSATIELRQVERQLEVAKTIGQLPPARLLR